VGGGEGGGGLVACWWEEGGAKEGSQAWTGGRDAAFIGVPCCLPACQTGAAASAAGHVHGPTPSSLHVGPHRCLLYLL
jgi:hypothetical protein